MQKFLSSSQYLNLKKKYEKEYFKLGGEYAWYDGDKIVKRSASNIAEYFKNKKVTITETTEDDDGETHVKIKVKTFYQIWSEDPKMKEYNEVVFNCDKNNVKNYQFNLFNGFAIEKYQHKENVNLKSLNKKLCKINDHIASLCNYNESHVNLVKWYMAHMLKKPHELPPMCLVFISKEGVGKDLFSELNENLIGDKYTFNVDKLDSIVGKFNTTMGGKILGVINETDPLDSSQRRDNIKFVISAKKLNIEGKHKDPVKTLNYCRLMFFANRYCAFPVEKGSRRPYVINCSDKYLPENIGAEANKKHFTELADIISDKDVQKLFYEELMKIDVDNFNFKEIEKSELHKILEDSAKPPLVDFITELIYKQTDNSKYVIHTIELLEKYTEYLRKRNMKFECSQKNFNVELQQVFKVEKFASNGRQKFRFNIQLVKDILLKEYKIDVTNQDDDNDFEEEETVQNMFVDTKDKAQYRVEEIISLKDKIEVLEDVNEDALSYIKKLEKYIEYLENKKEVNKMPSIDDDNKNKNSNKSKELTQISDTIFVDPKTNQEYEVEDMSLDDDDLLL